jgi:hypothetical protein
LLNPIKYILYTTCIFSIIRLTLKKWLVNPHARKEAENAEANGSGIPDGGI